MTNIRDVEVGANRETVLNYVTAHGIRVFGHYWRNGMLFVRMDFPPGSYAPFHREFGCWDVKIS